MEKLNFLAILVIFCAFQAGTAFTIDCVYGMVNYAVVGSSYRCVTTNVPASSNQTVTGVTGTHTSGRNNSHVNGIKIFGNHTLSFIPRGIKNFFPNINVLDMAYMAFETLHGDELDEIAPQLRIFFCYNGSLTSISSRFFESTQKLLSIGFSHNEIERVGRNLFTPVNVTQLTYLHFRDNPCVNRGADNSTTIVALINDLKVLCPYDETLTTTTTTTTTTATTTTTTAPTTITTTTSSVPACFDGSIEDFVCDLDEKVGVVQSDLAYTRDELESKLDETNQKLEETASELASIKVTVGELQDELAAKDQKIENIQNELDQRSERFEDEMKAVKEKLDEKDQRLNDQEGRLKWLEDELLRITTNPCACK
jgi:hypothetical protein